MSGIDIISGLLRSYLQPAATPAADAAGHFDQVSAAVPGSVLSQGITAAFESPQTPPFHDMVTQLFTNSDPAQRAAMLTTLLNAIPAEQRAALANSLGVSLPSPGATTTTGTATAPVISASQAQQVSPAAVTQAAEQAAAINPSIVGQLGTFYAQHPTLVKTLGSLAMIVAMRKIARHYPS